MARTVVVTGASSGIGEACAVRLAAAGWQVYGGVRSPGAGGLLARARHRASRARRHEYRANRRGGGNCRRQPRRTRRQRGHRDRGAARARPCRGATPSARSQRHRPGGRDAGVPAGAPSFPWPNRAHGFDRRAQRASVPRADAASKLALEAIADSLRVELRPWGIAVSIVEPASIKSGIWTKGASRADELRARLPQESDLLYASAVERFKKVALSRGPGGDPDDVARAVEHALTARRPKARYLVGRDAHVRAWIERLPTGVRDRVLARVLTE